MLYYSGDIINGTKINFRIILLDKKLYEDISVYIISYKTPTGPKPLRIRFHKVNRFVITLDGKIKHLIKHKVKHYLIMDCLIKFVILNIL